MPKSFNYSSNSLDRLKVAGQLKRTKQYRQVPPPSLNSIMNHETMT